MHSFMSVCPHMHAGKPSQGGSRPTLPVPAPCIAAAVPSATGAAQPTAVASISQQLTSMLPSSVVQAGPANSVFSAVTLLMVVVYSLILLVPRWRLVRSLVCSCRHVADNKSLSVLFYRFRQTGLVFVAAEFLSSTGPSFRSLLPQSVSGSSSHPCIFLPVNPSLR